MALPPLIADFVLHFGEMGSRWGINRTVGQIYALIYLSEKPINADEICEALGFSRSNVSMGLKELDSWGLVRMRHLPGDRRDHFAAPDDIWEIVRTLAEQRRRREIEPTLTMLRAAVLENPASTEETIAPGRMREMNTLLALLMSWYEDIQKMENERLVNLLKVGARVYKLYEMKDKLFVVKGGKKQKENDNG